MFLFDCFFYLKHIIWDTLLMWLWTYKEYWPLAYASDLGQLLYLRWLNRDRRPRVVALELRYCIITWFDLRRLNRDTRPLVGISELYIKGLSIVVLLTRRENITTLDLCNALDIINKGEIGDYRQNMIIFSKLSEHFFYFQQQTWKSLQLLPFILSQLFLC